MVADAALFGIIDTSIHLKNIPFECPASKNCLCGFGCAATPQCMLWHRAIAWYLCVLRDKASQTPRTADVSKVSTSQFEVQSPPSISFIRSWSPSTSINIQQHPSISHRSQSESTRCGSNLFSPRLDRLWPSVRSLADIFHQLDVGPLELRNSHRMSI